MSITHHLDASTLMAFAAGTLDEAYALVVSTHLAVCPQCRAEVDDMSAIGGALLESETAAPVSDGALDRLLAAADQAPEDELAQPPAPQDLRVPAPLARHVPQGLDKVAWRFRGPGVSTAELPLGPNAKSRLVLLKVAGGRRVPEHGHGGQEITLILQGAYTDRFGRFGIGDVADLDEDVEHQPVAEPGEACICLVALDSRLTFRGRLMNVIQPLIGL